MFRKFLKILRKLSPRGWWNMTHEWRTRTLVDFGAFLKSEENPLRPETQTTYIGKVRDRLDAQGIHPSAMATKEQLATVKELPESAEKKKLQGSLQRFSKFWKATRIPEVPQGLEGRRKCYKSNLFIYYIYRCSRL